MIIKHVPAGSQAYPRVINLKDTKIEQLSIVLKYNKYAIAVDPSSSSTGIIVGNVDTRKPVHIFALTRDKKNNETPEVYRDYLYSVLDKWVSDNLSKIVGIEVEQPIKGPKQTQANYATQMTIFYAITNIAKRYNIDCYVVSYKSWAKFFLSPYKESMGLNLNKKNKEATKKIAQTAFNEFFHLPDDCSDAYGIWCHYLAMNYKDGKELLTVGDNMREYTHTLMLNISNATEVKSFLQFYLKTQKTKHPNAEISEFIYNPKLSFEDNIRSFTSIKNKRQYNIFFARITPTVANMRYIIPYREAIGTLCENTPLFAIGYRVN